MESLGDRALPSGTVTLAPSVESPLVGDRVVWTVIVLRIRVDAAMLGVEAVAAQVVDGGRQARLILYLEHMTLGIDMRHAAAAVKV